MKNTKIMNNLNLTFFFNIVSLTFLTWISNHDNEVGNHNTYLNMNYFIGNTWKVRNDRLLTNDNPQSKIEQSGPSDNIVLPGAKNKLKDITQSSEIQEKIKKDASNSMHNYIKKLEYGYPNKKGLKRLDCYYEKKLFGEMYKLDKIVGHVNNKNSYLKKVIWKRYGLGFFIFSLVILFGIIVNIVCYFNNTSAQCGISSAPGDTCKDIETVLLVTNGIAYIPFIITFITYTIYILSKVRKYKRLKKRYGNIKEL